MLTETQYTLLRKYADTGAQPDGHSIRRWLDLTNAQERTRNTLLSQLRLSDEGDGMHAITEAGRQALAEFRTRHGLPIGA